MLKHKGNRQKERTGQYNGYVKYKNVDTAASVFVSVMGHLFQICYLSPSPYSWPAP